MRVAGCALGLLVVLGSSACAGGGAAERPPGPAPATVPASSAVPAPVASPGASGPPASGAAASGAAAFAHDRLAYPRPTGTPATGLGLGDTCHAFASIVHDPTLGDVRSAAELRALAGRTAITPLGVAMQGVADQFARRATVVQTVKADDLCN